MIDEITRFEIAKLELRQGDTLVVKIDDQFVLDLDQLNQIGERFKPYVPDGVKMCVMTAGVTLFIIRKTE